MSCCCSTEKPGRFPGVRGQRADNREPQGSKASVNAEDGHSAAAGTVDGCGGCGRGERRAIHAFTFPAGPRRVAHFHQDRSA